MAFDAHKNLAIATVVTPPSPAASGTTVVVGAGQGARFPAVPFNGTAWPFDMAPDPATAEVWRCTAIAGDTLTLVRAQEGTTARTMLAGDLIAATITAKSLTDIESGTNFPLVTVPGSLTTGGDVVLSGNGSIRRNTVDGADTGLLQVAGGGAPHQAYGATVTLYGNEHAGTGNLDLLAGNTATGAIQFTTAGIVRGRMGAGGCLSWGGTADGGPGTIFLGSSAVAGTAYLWLRTDGSFNQGTAGVAPANLNVFYNGNGLVGSIISTGTGVAYNTTSDARLKTPLSRHTDTDVLRDTIIHKFLWKSDGTPGRGVFAQEAARVAPFAVSLGSDEVDAEGRLTHPWGVDYSKYVPDLIVGWQRHEGELIGLQDTIDEQDDRLLNQRDEIAALTARLVALESRPSLMQWMRDQIAAWMPWKPSWI